MFLINLTDTSQEERWLLDDVSRLLHYNVQPLLRLTTEEHLHAMGIPMYQAHAVPEDPWPVFNTEIAPTVKKRLAGNASRTGKKVFVLSRIYI